MLSLNVWCENCKNKTVDIIWEIVKKFDFSCI